jgi:3-oxoacyl-[acyl-carrier-protein] synthase II
LLLSSAKLAIDDANLDINEENSSLVGVSIGTTLGSLNSISKFDKEARIDGPKYANPSVFPNTVVNSPASRVGIKFKITGFNSTISTGMCSALDALDFACDFIDLNKVGTVVVGAVEDLSIQAFLGCYKLKYLSGLGKNAPLSCPFDQRRDGIVLSEGAAVTVIEDLELALKRKSNIYAEILGVASCFDPAKYYKYNPLGTGMVSAMKLALNQANLQPEEIDCIYANANSTQDGDRIEAKAIKEVFGRGANNVQVTSIKSYLGESFGVAGGFSLVAAAVGFRENFIAPLLNYSNKDPKCDLRFVLNNNNQKPLSRVMINAFSPNGASSVVILGKYDSKY